MTRASVLRLLTVVATLLVLTGAWSPVARADETSVTFNLTNTGALAVNWANSDASFLVNGAEPGVSSSSAPVKATAEYRFTVKDTRADGARSGYRIVLSTTGLTANGSLASLGPAQLMITSVSAATGSGVSPTGAGLSLATPVTLVTVGDNAAAVDTTITLTLTLTILAGTMPGDYTGEFKLEVLPA